MNLAIAVNNLRMYFYKINFDSNFIFLLTLACGHLPTNFTPEILYEIFYFIVCVTWPASESLLDVTALKIIDDLY
jgi:hypothetical protein